MGKKGGILNFGKQNEIFQNRLQIKGDLFCGDDFYLVFNSISNFLFTEDKDFVFTMELNSGSLISFLCNDPFFYNKVKDIFFTILDSKQSGVEPLYFFDFENNVLENKMLLFNESISEAGEEPAENKPADPTKYQNINYTNTSNIVPGAKRNKETPLVTPDPFKSKYAKRQKSAEETGDSLDTDSYPNYNNQAPSPSSYSNFNSDMGANPYSNFGSTSSDTMSQSSFGNANSGSMSTAAYGNANADPMSNAGYGNADPINSVGYANADQLNNQSFGGNMDTYNYPKYSNFDQGSYGNQNYGNQDQGSYVSQDHGNYGSQDQSGYGNQDFNNYQSYGSNANYGTPNTSYGSGSNASFAGVSSGSVDWNEIVKELGTLMLHRNKIDDKKFNDIFLAVTNKSESYLKQSINSLGPVGYDLLNDLNLTNFKKVLKS